MDKDTSEIIKDHFNELPQEMRDAITAADLPVRMKKIAQNQNLMIDQIGSLQNEILLVMLGIEPSSEFIKNVSKELGVSNSKSLEIAKEVNDSIFGSIRTYLREWEEQAGQSEENAEHFIPQKNNSEDFSSIEQAGDFSVEKRTVEHGVPIEAGEDTIEHKDDILAGIENPQAGNEKISRKESSFEQRYLEPLIDHLLKGSVSQPQEKVTSTPVVTTTIAVTTATTATTETTATKATTLPLPPKKPGVDPYMEAI